MVLAAKRVPKVVLVSRVYASVLIQHLPFVVESAQQHKRTPRIVVLVGRFVVPTKFAAVGLARKALSMGIIVVGVAFNAPQAKVVLQGSVLVLPRKVTVLPGNPAVVVLAKTSKMITTIVENVALLARQDLFVSKVAVIGRKKRSFHQAPLLWVLLQRR